MPGFTSAPDGNYALSRLLPLPFGGTCKLEDVTMQVLPLAADNAAPKRLHRDGDSGAIMLGRLRYNDAPPAQPGPSAQEIFLRWVELGDAILDRLTGEFLIALWNAKTNEALVATDRFSTLPLFWAQGAGRIGFAATPADAAREAGVGLEPSWQAIFEYAYFHMIPAPMSIYQGVRRLDVGEAIRVRDGRAEVFRYWTPVFREHEAFDFGHERELFLSALRDGVAECTAGFRPDQIGCFLSGGTDSSTIAGLATRQFDTPARTFAIGFDVGGYDETHYSRLAAKHFGTAHTEYFVTANDVYAGVEAVATQYEQPFGNSSALPTFFCARLAREAGIERMLGGDGGDELYGGNERYAKQAIFSLYDNVPSSLRSAALEPLLFGALGKVDTKVFAKARSYIEQAKVPLPDRIQARYNLLNHLGIENIFTDAFLANVAPDAALALEREVWGRARTHPDHAPMSQLNRFLAWDFKFTLGDSDLPKVTRMCQAAGVEVAFPMLTHALVEHSLRLRPGEKLKGRRLRHFFKESLRGFLPDEIIEKKKQGFGLPFGSWVLTHEHLRSTATDALRSLTARGIIRPEFLQRLLADLATGHSGYYGTMVWILTVLELWLRASPIADARVGST